MIICKHSDLKNKIVYDEDFLRDVRKISVEYQTNMSKKFVTILLLLFVVIGVGIYFLGFFQSNDRKEGGVTLIIPDSPKEKESTPPPPVVTLKEAQPGSLPLYSGEPARLLNPDPKTAAAVGQAVLNKYTKRLGEIADGLSSSPDIENDWLGVAYIKKLFNNYLGARDALEYLKIVNPQHPIAHFNLGELYGYELHDAAKAELNYKAAVRLDPYHLDYYVGLANFYKDVVKSREKAEATLLSALEKIPHTEPNLFAAIGAFYSGEKNYSTALEYFEKALNAADATRDPGIKKAIQNEIDYIRSKSPHQPGSR